MIENNYAVEELAEKARDGNKPSLEKLVEIFQKDIFRMIYYRIRSSADADDLTQEVFMQMVKSLQSLKDTNQFKPWLYRIALNRVRDFYRKKKIMTFFSASNEADDLESLPAQNHNNPVDNLIKKEFLEQFHCFTNYLPHMEREVFLLRFVDNLGIREITQALKKNESTVKTHLYRALKKFKQNPGIHEILKGKTNYE